MRSTYTNKKKHMYLGTGIYNVVPSCCGFKFIPDFAIASKAAGIT